MNEDPEFKCEYGLGCECPGTKFLHVVLPYRTEDENINNSSTIQALCEFHYKLCFKMYSDMIQTGAPIYDLQETSINEYKVMRLMVL